MTVTPSSPRIPLLLAALSAAGLLLGSCSTNQDSEADVPASPSVQPPLSLEVTDGHPVAVRGNYSLGGPAMEAALEGELEIAAGGCLHLDTGEDAPKLLVFPQDAEPIERGRPGIKIGSTEVMVGDRFSVGGGSHQLTPEQTQAASACVPEEEVFLVQSFAG